MAAQIKTQEEFDAFTAKFWETHDKPYAFGIGQTFRDTEGEGDVIAVRWLKINLEENFGTAAALIEAVEAKFGGSDQQVYYISDKEAAEILDQRFQWCMGDGKVHENLDALACHTSEFTLMFYYEADEFEREATCMEDVHFRMALMSRQMSAPNSMNTESIFGLLPNLIWTNFGVHTPEDWNRLWISGENSGEIALAHDKFPPMYWANPAPAGVRVANTTMMRHGHHAAPDSTYMHYAFGNFNAGTLGKAMVEGRISAGTVIGAGSDIGAGAGFLGTLSGGNSIRMSMGENCLLGAMAECGIPLGDNVLIKEGVVFSAGTLVAVVTWKTGEDGKFITGENGKPIEIERKVVKAIELEGISNVTFRQNSQTGAIEVLPIPNKVKLNDMLHAND